VRKKSVERTNQDNKTNRNPNRQRRGAETQREDGCTLISMHEPAVAVTDFILAAECAVFTVLAARRLVRGSYRTWVLAFFASIAVGALLGGMAHAWFFDESVTARAVWVATMIAVGMTAMACWVLGAEVLQKRWVPLRASAVAAFVVYVGFVLAGWRAYKFVIADYLPAAIFLLIASLIARRWVMAVGLMMTFGAAAIQVARIALPPLDHNALYHVVQAAALLLMFVGLVGREVRQG
jgi:hypothetical protein